MNEKSTILSSDDYGDDVAAVQALLKTHEGLERDLSALNDKVHAIHFQNSRTAKLLQNYVTSALRYTLLY